MRYVRRVMTCAHLCGRAAENVVRRARREPLKKWFVAAAICGFQLSASAATTGGTDEATKFVTAFVNAIEWVKEADNAMSEIEKPENSRNEVEIRYENLVARDRFESAVREVEPFQSSENKMIEQVAGATIHALRSYQKQLDDWMALHNDLEAAIAQAQQDGKVRSLTAFTERTAQLKFAADKAGELLLNSAVGASWVLFKFQSEDKPVYPLAYAVTKADREAISADLIKTFGQKIRHGPATKLTWVENAAAVMYVGITQKERPRAKR